MTNASSAKVAGIISIIANVILTVIKVGIGLWAGSEALFSDGVHSAIDIVASVAALSALIIAYRPADKDHPYGHGKAEDLASSLVSLILISVGFYVLYSSITALFHPVHFLGQAPLYAAAISLVTKEVLYRYTAKLNRKLNSPALESLAQDHRSDIWGSWAALIGVAGSLIGFHTGLIQLAYMDPIAAFLVGLLILRTSIKMGKTAVSALMERNVDEELLTQYHDVVMSVPEVKRLDKIRARHLGHYVLVDVRVSVHGTKSVQEGHDISHLIKTQIIDAHPEVKEVLVHLNPYYEASER